MFYHHPLHATTKRCMHAANLCVYLVPEACEKIAIVCFHLNGYHIWVVAVFIQNHDNTTGRHSSGNRLPSRRKCPNKLTTLMFPNPGKACKRYISPAKVLNIHRVSEFQLFEILQNKCGASSSSKPVPKSKPWPEKKKARIKTKLCIGHQENPCGHLG